MCVSLWNSWERLALSLSLSTVYLQPLKHSSLSSLSIVTSLSISLYLSLSFSLSLFLSLLYILSISSTRIQLLALLHLEIVFCPYVFLYVLVLPLTDVFFLILLFLVLLSSVLQQCVNFFFKKSRVTVIILSLKHTLQGSIYVIFRNL